MQLPQNDNLTLSQTNPGFNMSAVKYFDNNVGKWAMSNFTFSQSVFYPFGGLSAIFIGFKIVTCKLFQFGRI